MPLNSIVSPLAITTTASQTREKLPQRKNGVKKKQTPSALRQRWRRCFLYFFRSGLKNILYGVFKCLRFRKFMTLD